MRVLVLSTSSHDPGNRERLRAIVGLGAELILATPGGNAGTDGGIRLAPVPVRGDVERPEELHWKGRVVRRLLTELTPSLVHIEADPESPLADTTASLCRKLAIPYVLFGWQSLPRPLGFFARRRAHRVLAGATGVIGGNKLAMALLHAEAPGAIAAAIPPAGVTLPPSTPRPPRDILCVGFAGRLVPERGADLLVAALGQTYGRWSAVVAGTGPEQEALEATIQRLGLAARIRWLGGIRSETLEELWREIDCLVVPSRDTPTWVDHHSPLLLEAMGRGIAPIVTQAGALPELVGRAGVVVDGVEALVEALQRWVADPAKCRAAGAGARHWVTERYVTSVVAARTLEFWQAAVEQAAHSQPATQPA